MRTIIFTDGASRGNPGAGGWGAVLVLQNQNGSSKVVELGGHEDHTTNNRMELTAAIKALEFVSFYKLSTINYQLIIIYTDSNYLINGITKWIYSWEKRNWVTKNKEPVLNKDLWENLLELVKNKKIEWKHVAGHSGVSGNERADGIATAFADRNPLELYSGLLSGYEHLKTPPPTSKAKTGKRGKAYSYVSMINGVIKTHKTWAECEKRVKGKSGAKYKKVFSAEEEKKIIESWRK